MCDRQNTGSYSLIQILEDLNFCFFDWKKLNTPNGSCTHDLTICLPVEIGLIGEGLNTYN